MQRVSLVIASLPNYNPGMIAVNLAALRTLDRAGADLRVYEAVSRQHVLEYESGIELIGRLNELFDADKIVLWGDWLHMQGYIADLSKASMEASKLSKRPVSYQRLIEHLFLLGLPAHRMSDTAIVGTTFALDSPLARLDEGFGEHIQRLYGEAGLVLMRDAFSAGLVEAWRSKRDRCSGLDAAFLYRPRDGSATRFGDGRSPFGFFLGRSTAKQMALARRLIAGLQEALHLEAFWIPWFANSIRVHLGARGRAKATLLSSSPFASRVAYKWKSVSRTEQVALDVLIAKIRACAFIVTDTYHLAVISWSQGVPCILLGNSSSLNRSFINSGAHYSGLDKRMGLYLTLDALSFFVPYEDLGSIASSRERLDFLLSQVTVDSYAVQRTMQMIDDRRESFRSDFDAWWSAPAPLG